VVLHNGSPVEMPWIHRVKAVLEMYLGGQGVGQATVELLYGEANPCGKLAESFPIKLEDNPSHLFFAGNREVSEYREGVFVGYRYYDKKKTDVLFPFGHGMSYTKFEYSNLQIDKNAIKDTETLCVSIDITNIGERAGKEIVQLYISDKTGSAVRPLKELKGFEKVSLAPGETKTVSFKLDKRSFAWYNTAISDWYCASGEYEISIAASSRDIRLYGTVHLESTTELPFVVTENTRIEELLAHPKTAQVIKMMIDRFSSNIKIGESDASKAAINDRMAKSILLESPLRTIRNLAILRQPLSEIIHSLNALI
jgi:beta-glucosidase